MKELFFNLSLSLPLQIIQYFDQPELHLHSRPMWNFDRRLKWSQSETQLFSFSSRPRFQRQGSISKKWRSRQLPLRSRPWWINLISKEGQRVILIKLPYYARGCVKGGSLTDRRPHLLMVLLVNTQLLWKLDKGKIYEKKNCQRTIHLCLNPIGTATARIDLFSAIL